MKSLDERVVEILNKPDNNPALTNNMAYALIGHANLEIQNTIQDYIEQKDWAKLGLKIYMLSVDYQEYLAESEASEQFNQSLGE